MKESFLMYREAWMFLGLLTVFLVAWGLVARAKDYTNDFIKPAWRWFCEAQFHRVFTYRSGHGAHAA
jgi:hypothetical protein